MPDILWTILSFNVLIVLFKLFPKYNIDTLQVLIINYFVAGLYSLYFSNQDFSIYHIMSSPWIIHAIIIGILFIVTFNLFAIGTQRIGIALATISNKLSLLIPVGFALLLYPEEKISGLKTIGFIMAIASIYFSSKQEKKLSFNKRYVWLILLLFVSQGIADTVFNNAQKTVVNEDEKGLFLMCLLFISGISGTIILLGKSIRKRPELKIRNFIAGIIFSIPNFLTITLFFNALENSGLPAAQVYPIMSMGIIILSAITGLIVFKENLTTKNWLGLVLAVLSIYLIALIEC